MDAPYYSAEVYDGIDYTEDGFPKGEYEECSFSNCILSNTDLGGCTFLDCVFSDCDISLAQLVKTSFRDVKFINCKMLGLQFDTCNDFSVLFSFDTCILDHSSFTKLNIKATEFKGCLLQNVDFAECDLSGAVFEKCNLDGAHFEFTNLEKADFRAAYNYSLDPDKNKIKKARFSADGLAGLLHKYDIDIEE